jgi:hypothetical protein
LQVQEAAHNHGAQDPAGHCLICKHSADSAPGLSEPVEALPDVAVLPTIHSPRAAAAPAPSHLFARAPPPIS